MASTGGPRLNGGSFSHCGCELETGAAARILSPPEELELLEEPEFVVVVTKVLALGCALLEIRVGLWDL